MHEEEQPQQRPLTPLRPWVREDETPVPDVPTTPEPDASASAETDTPATPPGDGGLEPARPWQLRRAVPDEPAGQAGRTPSNERSVLTPLTVRFGEPAPAETTAEPPAVETTPPTVEPAPVSTTMTPAAPQTLPDVPTPGHSGRLRRAAGWLFEQAAERSEEQREEWRSDQRADRRDEDEPTWTRAELLDLARPAPAEPEPEPEPPAEPEPEAKLESQAEPEPVPEPEPEPEPEHRPRTTQAGSPRPRPRPTPIQSPGPETAPAVAPPTMPRTATPPAVASRAVPARPSVATATAQPQRRGVRWLLQTLVTVCIVVVVALLLRSYVAAPYFIPSASMEPTLHGCTGCNNDHVLVNKLAYKLHAVHRGDVVVFNRPPTWQVSEPHLIKRVIGLPGDVLTVSKGKLYVNGLQLDEPYLDSVCGPMTSLGESPNKPTTKYGPVPKGEVFVMGDNRCDSSDSRAFGPVPEADIVGRAFVIIWPLGRLHYL